MQAEPYDPKEIEETLIIRSETPDYFSQQIAALPCVAGYQLEPQDDQQILDSYFDTPDRSLKSKRLSLRIRQIGANYWITLKGPSKPAKYGGKERLEIEYRWSEKALQEIAQRLKDKGIKLQWNAKNFRTGQPLNTMNSLGFLVIQTRENHRITRNIVSSVTGSVLAELVIDSVVYHFDKRKIAHHEVEIEAKASDGAMVLTVISSKLIEKYGPVLQVWNHGKLQTGNAIEELLNENKLEGLLGNDNNLMPAAYDIIDDYFKKERRRG